MQRYHIAQVNVARPLAPLDSEQLAGFVQMLDPINQLADGSPGFVWRLATGAGNATALRLEDPQLLVNLSVWESIEALSAFVYRSDHVAVMRRRKQWFESMTLYMALWWVPAGELPSIADAEARLARLREHGPTPQAFSFRERFAAPGQGAQAGERASTDLLP
jgi:heme-degrading monooxygenase HmoA